MSEKVSSIDDDKKHARNFLLNNKARKPSRQVVTFEHDGEHITAELREPSVAQLSKILEKSGFTDEHKHRVGLVGVYAAIELLFVPGTHEHLFTPADLPALLEIPMGSFLEEVAQLMMNVVVEAQKVGKTSAPTDAADSSSP